MKISTYARLSNKGRRRANIMYHIETAIIGLLAASALVGAGWFVLSVASGVI